VSCFFDSRGNVGWVDKLKYLAIYILIDRFFKMDTSWIIRNFLIKQICIWPLPSAVDMTPPAFAAELLVNGTSAHYKLLFSATTPACDMEALCI